MDNEDQYFFSTCGLDCGSSCLLKVRVKEGIVQGITTDDQPGPGLKACPRGLTQRNVLYAQDRLQTPLKRVGERGSGRFEPVSWEEALDHIARELQKMKDQYGPQSIFWLGHSGSAGLLHNTGRTGPGGRFFSLFGGYTTSWGNTSAEAAIFSSLMTFGNPFTRNSRDNFLDSKLIILWGWNPLVTRFGPDTIHYLVEAKKKGTRFICVDPRLNQTAKLLEAQWVPIKPATDTALLLAMAYVVINEDLYDHAFVEKYTTGFDWFEEYVMGGEDNDPKTPDWAEKRTGVPAETIIRLAREYAMQKPAALCTGWAAGRTAYGEQFHRAVSVLAALTGNIGIAGGFVSGGTDSMALGSLRGLPIPKSPISRIHVCDLYDLFINGRAGGFPNDIKILYITGCNLLNQWPNVNKGKEALKRPDLIVVHDLFMTPTARYADLVLPVAHFLEREDLGQPWAGGPYNLIMEKAVEPLNQVKSDLEIFGELASRLGINDFNKKTDEEWLQDFTASHPGFPGYTQFKKEKAHHHTLEKTWVAFRQEIEDPDDHPFKTPSGKIEIYSQKIAEMKDPLIPPIPKYIAPWEGPMDPLTQDYPFQLVSPHSRARVNSSLDNIARLKSIADDELWLNTEDAAKLKLKPGEEVRVFNGRGEILRKVRITDRIMTGVVSLDAGAWYHPDELGVDQGGCVNMLTVDKKSPAGAFPCNSCLVQVSAKKEK